MHVLDLTIGTRHFSLPEGTDVRELEHRIEGAVRAGGAMVRIPSPGDHATSALVTSATTVFIEHLDVPDHDPEAASGHPSQIDFDLTDQFSEWDA
jgi:hypothetical protein